MANSAGETIMTVISKRVFRPLPGKASLSHDRVRRLAEIITRAGGRVRTTDVVWGDGAREIHLYGVFPNIEEGGKTWTKLAADPAFTALRSEGEKDPASSWEGPEVWRCVFGEPQSKFPVILQREYEMDRRGLKSAIALLPEVQALHNYILALIPIISGDMGRFMVAYYAESLIDLGQHMDRIGTSDAFQSILVRAAEHGKLMRSRVLLDF
jgi:hypothetical protein